MILPGKPSPRHDRDCKCRVCDDARALAHPATHAFHNALADDAVGRLIADLAKPDAGLRKFNREFK
jgi:hypothetical protein